MIFTSISGYQGCGMQTLGESYLRGVVVSASKAAQTPNELIKILKEQANTRLGLMQQAQGLMGSSQNLETAALGMAIQGLEIACHALAMNLQETKWLRKQFSDECEQHIATFILDDAKEDHTLSKEERCIKAFWKSLQKNCPSFFNYFGIQEITNGENPKIRKLSILPFFKMSQALEQKQLLASKLDYYQQSIYLFLKTDLPLDHYYQAYQKTANALLFLEGLWSKQNFLNNFRAPRFIIIAMANLLWNLQHPVDSDTGIPLCLNEAANRCSEAKFFFDLLLDKSQEKGLWELDDSKEYLYRFLLQVELHIQNLQEAFIFENLHEINLIDVSRHMHRALRVMADKTLELIYKNNHASEQIVGLFLELGSLIQRYPLFIEKFFLSSSNSFLCLPYFEKNRPAFLNDPPSSLIDVLILFSHLNASQRKQLIEKTKKHPHEPFQQIARNLTKIDLYALRPYENICFGYLQTLENKPVDSQTFIAQRFLAFMVLVMECFTLQEDTRNSKFFNLSNNLKDKTQRQLILENAHQASDNHYYHWCLSFFLKKLSATSKNLDNLLVMQYSMLKYTKFLDKLGHLALTNRHLLQQKTFQEMLVHVLKTICETYDKLNMELNNIELQMQNDEQLERFEKRILQPMLDDLESACEKIEKSILQVNKILSAPTFIEQEKTLMNEQNHDIEQDYKNLFHQPMPITNNSLALEPLLEVDYKQDCLNLIQDCLKNLSMPSFYGEKIHHLNFLKNELLIQKTMPATFTKTWLLKLLKLTATPTQTFFFQAKFGETKTCQRLIQNIQQNYPWLIELLFPEKVTVETAKMVIEHIKESGPQLPPFGFCYQHRVT